MRRFLIPVLLIALLSTLLMTACGGDDDSSTDVPEATDPPTATDVFVAPTEIPTEAATSPPTALPTATEVIVGDFTLFMEALEAAGLVDELNEMVPYTVFAPPDVIYQAYLDEQGLSQEEFLADTEALTAFLGYHIVSDGMTSSMLITMNGETLATLAEGEEIVITVSEEGDLILNGTTTVIQTDRMASNGLIHVIDSVLLPPTEEMAETVTPEEEDTEAIEATETVEAMEAIEATEVVAPEETAVPETTATEEPEEDN